ncbi:hypothetical protein BD770DRAFT_390889 [Pilaira anomala]|nr:hypothetical protein BD770DRAFT_390889 [Pilaira anomala]
MLDKANRLARCLRLQDKEDIVIQDKSCTERPFYKFKEQCRSCENNGPCSFKGLRGFKISKKTKSLLHGPYFPPTNKVDPFQHLKSERFTSTTPSSPLSSTSSTSPASAAAYAIKKIKSVFNSVLQRQKTITNINKPIRRENPEGDRHFCDYCYTSLFNYHYVCSICALEICPDCYRELNATSDDELLTCKNGIKHHPDEFVLLSKLIEESMDYLIQSTSATASDSNNVENEINHDSKTNENSKQCKDNSSVDTNTESSTTTNIINTTVYKKIQTYPTTKPIPEITYSMADKDYTNLSHLQQQVAHFNNYINNSPHDTYPNQTRTALQSQFKPLNYSNSLNGSDSKDMFLPCFENNLEHIPLPITSVITHIATDVPGSSQLGVHQDVRHYNNLKKRPLEDPYCDIIYDNFYDNHKQSHEFDFFSQTRTRKKGRRIDNVTVYHQYVPPKSASPEIDIMNNDNDCDQSIPPIPSTEIHYVYPEIEEYNLYHDIKSARGSYNGFTDFTSQTLQSSRVILTPKTQRPLSTFASSQISPLTSSPESGFTPSLSEDFNYSQMVQSYPVDSEMYSTQVANSQCLPVLESYSPQVIKSQYPSLLEFYPPRSVISYKSHSSPVVTSPSSPTPKVTQTTFSPPNYPSMLNAPASALTSELFQAYWQLHQPVMISDSIRGSQFKWTPELFESLCGDEKLKATDIDGMVYEVSGKDYFAAFSDSDKRKKLCSILGSTEVLKIKDLPPNETLRSVFPKLHEDFMKTLVTSDYSTDNGYYNLANRLPEEYLPPDLGPKLFINYGIDEQCRFGKTNLHCDITDAVNVMYYADDKTTKERPVAAALWHIFPFECMRSLCEYISLVKDVGSLHPILDHGFYLDDEDLKKLKNDYGVTPFTVHQNPGDTVYIPAGCAHQVATFSNSIKCAFDFFSPENIDRSVFISDCFRSLKRIDKLQVANTLTYAWKSLQEDLKK